MRKTRWKCFFKSCSQQNKNSIVSLIETTANKTGRMKRESANRVELKKKILGFVQKLFEREISHIFMKNCPSPKRQARTSRRRVDIKFLLSSNEWCR